MKAHIPNIATLLNLFCGCIAIIFAVNSHFLLVALFVVLGICFDVFDGLLARKLNVQSPLGIQLDSLADMATSGVVPGIVMYKFIEAAVGGNSSFVVNKGWNQTITWDDANLTPIALVGLLIPLASAYRLAKFNIDTEQQSYFKGLPVPANTLLIISMPLILHFQYSITASNLFSNVWFLIGLTLFSCYLLNANIKLFALKFKTWAFQPNALRYLFLLACIVLLLLLHVIAIPIIVLFYIALSSVIQKSIT